MVASEPDARNHLGGVSNVSYSCRVAARSELLQVGWFDPAQGITLLEEVGEAVASWLSVEQIAPMELQFSS